MSQKTANAVALGLTVAVSVGGASAVSASPAGPGTCRLVGSDKIPPERGGVSELCRMITAIAREKAPSAAFAVEIRMASTSALVATVRMKNGRSLGEHNLAINDGVLDRQSIAKFAAHISGQISDAAHE